MKTVNPYLNFPGTTEEAFNFYKSVFGGEFSALMRFRDFNEGGQMPPDALDKIMHISLPIGNDGGLIMATDALESMGQKLNTGNNFYIYVNTNSTEEADRYFNALAAGGEVEMKLEKTFWGAYYGALKDKFGIQWMINFDFPKA